MDDLISRQAAIDAYILHTMDYLVGEKPRRAFTEVLRELPPAQPERESGEWIRNDNGTYSCSVCQSWIPEEQHYYARYCLHCGSKMGGKS